MAVYKVLASKAAAAAGTYVGCGLGCIGTMEKALRKVYTLSSLTLKSCKYIIYLGLKGHEICIRKVFSLMDQNRKHQEESVSGSLVSCYVEVQ